MTRDPLHARASTRSGTSCAAAIPSMWIDNCASGGRRIDLETLSRSLPLWPSDFPDIVGLRYGLGLHVGDQCINAGLARWVPLFGGGVWNFTPYSTRGEIIGGFTFGFHIDLRRATTRRDDAALVELQRRPRPRQDAAGRGFPHGPGRAAIAEWKSIRPFFLGDFYLLLPLTVAPHDWCAWQFHRADLDAGFAALLPPPPQPLPHDAGRPARHRPCRPLRGQPEPRLRGSARASA